MISLDMPQNGGEENKIVNFFGYSEVENNMDAVNKVNYDLGHASSSIGFCPSCGVCPTCGRKINDGHSPGYYPYDIRFNNIQMKQQTDYIPSTMYV